MSKENKFIKSVVLGAGLAILLASGIWWIAQAAHSPDSERVPGRHWSWTSPEKAGFSREKLDVFSGKVGGAGCIVQGGQMVYEWGDTTFRNDVASAAKPLYAFLTLKAVETGLIGSLDDPVVDWVPELKGLNRARNFKDRNITFRYLLEQTSGYGLVEKPGEAFAYNDFGTGLLIWSLVYRVYRCSPGQEDDLLNGELLGQAIGFEDQPTLLHPLSPPGRIRISARDFARFGLLYLRGGRWGGRVVLREDLFHLAMSPPRSPPLPRTSGIEVQRLRMLKRLGGGSNEQGSLGCLGYFWWFNQVMPDGSLLLPNAPLDTFMGMGYGGQFVVMIMPERDEVVVCFDIYGGHNGRPFDTVGRFWLNKVFKELLQTRLDSSD